MTRRQPAIWFEEVSAQGVLETGHAPKQPLGSGDEAVLSEAIRFFNLLHPAVQRAGWEPLRFRDAELTETRAELHDALFEYLLLATHQKNLEALVPQAKMQELFPKETSSEPKAQTKAVGAKGGGKKFPFNHTSRAKLLIRALLLPEWRDSGLRPPLAPLMWDQIAPALEQLRKLTRRDQIEAELEATFGRSVLTPPGGDQGLHLLDSKMTEITLAEKLYSQVGAIVTRLSLIPTWLATPSLPTPINVPGQVPFSLHIKARAAAEIVLLAALPWEGVRDDTFPDLFGTWLLTIDVMEDWLMAVASTSWGAAAGVGWGLALTATLRAYVIDALASLFMTALPLSRLHEQAGSSRGGSLFTFRYGFGPSAWRSDAKSKPESSPKSKTKPKPPTTSDDSGPNGAYKSYYNALLALGLWECLSGTIAPHPNPGYSGFLVENTGDKLLGVMSKWKADAMPDAWGSGSVSREHADLSRYLAGASRKPFFFWKSTLDKGTGARVPNDTSDGLDWQNASCGASSDILKSWPAHPAFLFDIENAIATIVEKTPKKETKSPPPQWKEIRDEDHFGTLFSQLSLFVARFLAASFAKALNLTEPSQPAKGSKDPPKPRLLKALGYEGGSLMWGGCNYTHLEHRFGSVFDISHRYKYEKWPLLSIVPYKRARRQQMYDVLRGDSTSFSSQIVHNYLPKDQINRIVLDSIKAFDSGSALADIENDILKGTPILSDHGRLLVNLVGHIALLLAAPYKMIAGSPITHLRSIRLVQKALEKLKPESLRTFSKSFLTHESLEFIFMPHNHYDHWHVVFLAVPGSSGDNSLARGEGKASAPNIKSICTFWRRLGLPLEEFYDYLKGLELTTTIESNVSNAEKEKNWLLQTLEAIFKEIPRVAKEVAASQFAPFIELLKDREFIEWNPKGDEFSGELKKVLLRSGQTGDPIGDGNEILQSRSEHDELMSVDPGAAESPP